MTVLSLENKIRPSVHWVIREWAGGVWVAVREFDNLVTNFGLTALASAPAGQYTSPIYLVVDSASTTMFSTANSGTSSVTLTNDPTITGDTQLVLSVGLGAQETVTFNAKSGSGPYTFTLTANLVNTHNSGDPVVRAVTAADTMTSVVSEATVDPTNNPGNRVTMAAAYSPGVGQYTMQFFIAGISATNLYFAHVGLTDQLGVGAAGSNLHNYAALGYNHNNTNDLEVDAAYTLQTF